MRLFCFEHLVRIYNVSVIVLNNKFRRCDTLNNFSLESRTLEFMSVVV